MNIYIVVFCLEAWLLGNKKVGPRNPVTQELRAYKNFFDVLTNDPEQLPDYPNENLNRAQFSFLYLKKMLKEKRIHYSKGSPKAVCHRHYFEEIVNRYHNTSHIVSFSSFLDAFNF